MAETQALVGSRATALTAKDKRVRILVTAIEAEHDHGTEVWGYRWNTRTREFASTSFPRRYFIPKAAR